MRAFLPPVRTMTAGLFRSLCFATLSGFVLASTAGAQEAAPSPPVTGYIEVEAAEVPVRQILTGRAVAKNATQLRPRVGGEIIAILYNPGVMVEAGTPLFRIDPLTYQAELASAEANLASAAAELQASEAAFERMASLRSSAATSQAAYDTAEAALLKARASHAAAEAKVNLAKAQLDWTTVRAPISGLVGVAQVSLGDLVTQGQSQPLTEIVQIDPIQIDLSEPYQVRLRVEARAERGEVTLDAPEMALVVEGGAKLEGRARLVSSAATVSATTGTRTIRFEMDNPEGRIAPGMFVQAELTLGRERAVLVPQRATERARDGRLSAWVAKDGKAEKRWLTETGTSGSSWVVQAGIEAGDWLLMDGITKLREGMEISPVPVFIDDEGVVRDAAGKEADAALMGN